MENCVLVCEDFQKGHEHRVQTGRRQNQKQASEQLTLV